MPDYRFDQHALHARLVDHARRMNAAECHLRHLTQTDDRMAAFSAKGGGMFLDYTRQRVNAATMDLLFELADAAAAMDRFKDMADGKTVNVTENRAALHMAARSFSATPLEVNGRDVKPDLQRELGRIRAFSDFSALDPLNRYYLRLLFNGDGFSNGV